MGLGAKWTWLSLKFTICMTLVELYNFPDSQFPFCIIMSAAWTFKDNQVKMICIKSLNADVTLEKIRYNKY